MGPCRDCRLVNVGEIVSASVVATSGALAAPPPRVLPVRSIRGFERVTAIVWLTPSNEYARTGCRQNE